MFRNGVVDLAVFVVLPIQYQLYLGSQTSDLRPQTSDLRPQIAHGRRCARRARSTNLCGGGRTSRSVCAFRGVFLNCILRTELSFHARHGPHRHTIRALAPARGGTSSWHRGWVQMHRVRTDARRGGSWGGSRLTDDGPHALVRSASGGSGSERGLRVRDLRSEISVTTDHVT